MKTLDILQKKFNNSFKPLSTKQKNVLRILKRSFQSLYYKDSPFSNNLPKVLQFPITTKCNARCVMCNIWQMDNSKDLNYRDFENTFEDKLFREVTSIGINGGEPFMMKDILGFFNAALKSPKLNSISLITNGFNCEKIFKDLPIIYKACKKKGVSLNVTVSVDGVKEIHDKVRGIKGIHKRTYKTVNGLLKKQGQFYDFFDIACTISKDNIYNFEEVIHFGKKNKIPVNLRFSSVIDRIESGKLINDHDVLLNEESSYRQDAKEILHNLFNREENIHDKFKYFSLFYWLNFDNKKRLLGCAWKSNGAVLDAKGDLFYCAVASEKIGNIKNKKPIESFFLEDNLKHREYIHSNRCASCTHDYDGHTSFSNYFTFVFYLIKDKSYPIVYRFLSLLSRIPLINKITF